jgi:hypothetical protein
VYPVPRRFWFAGGFSFEIASWDWDLASGWCWDCPGDNFVVYDDPDHPGWYFMPLLFVFLSRPWLSLRVWRHYPRLISEGDESLIRFLKAR